MEEEGTGRNIYPVKHFTIELDNVRGLISVFFMDVIVIVL